MFSLINPPNPPNGVSNKDTMGGFGQLYPPGSKHSFPPLDMLFSAAVLRQKQIDVEVIDCLGLDWDLAELVFHLHKKDPAWIGIRTSAPTFEWDMRVAKIVKLTTHAKVIVFGPYVTIHGKEALGRSYVDAIILGEPEITLSEIFEGDGFSTCEGVGYRDESGIVFNPPREPLADLDELPFPAWDLVPYRKYRGSALMRNLTPFVTTLTSKGCPNGCAYCPYPVVQGRKLRTRSPERVIDELKWLNTRLGVKAVLFRDPEFAFYRERVVAICKGISGEGLSLAWRCETRMEDLDEELIALMANAGCIGINMGVESADVRVLQKMNRKPIPQERAKRILEACKRFQVDSFCFFVLGLPGESREAAINTIRYAMKLNPDFLQFTVATPYPGTALESWATENHFIETTEDSSVVAVEPPMRNEHMTSEEIRRLQWLANEARNMGWRQVGKRVLRSTFHVASELRRCVRYWQEKTRVGL